MSRRRLSVRTKLTVVYGSLFLIVGAALLVINYVLVDRALPHITPAYANTVLADADSATQVVPAQRLPPAHGAPMDTELLTGALAGYRETALSTLLIGSGIALVVAAALAVLLGWWTASRALRPVHTITATASKLGAGDLDHRINHDGPADELKELADAFDTMLDRLDKAFDSQKRFVANASHELRTPLAVQRTLAEVALADPTADPRTRRLGTHLLEANERSERLIEALLLVARSDRGLSARTPVRLDEITRAVLDATAPQAEAADVTVHADLSPRVVAGDEMLLERLVTNLVVNAITYNVRGGSVRVEVAADPALTVRNTGVEVPEERTAELFEPFRRLDPDRTGDGRNVGLGLSIVRSIAAAHDGTADAHPNPGGGLVITIHLPA